MIDQTIFKDVTEIHGRLLDHKPVLQGHIHHFLHEFEEKRRHREKDRLNKIQENINDMNAKLIPESIDAMKVFLCDVSAKVKVATEMCQKIEDGEIFENKTLVENRKSRKERWEAYLQGQYQNCDEIDRDFNEQIELVKSRYVELEENLGYPSQ